MLVALPASIAVAAPGQLDPTFGVGGIAGEPLEPHYRGVYFLEVKEEPDASLLATRGTALLVRYTPSGQLDPGFPPQKPPRSKVQALQPDGKVLEAGETLGRKIRRLNPDGTPDQSFNGGESEEFDIYQVGAIEVLPSGKILVIGRTLYEGGARSIIEQVGVARLNPEGTIDRGFGGDELVELRRDSGVEGESFLGAAAQADGGLVIVAPGFVVRLGPDGTLDRTYGDGGKAPLENASIVGFRATADGAVAVAGSTYDVGCGTACNAADFFVAHLSPAGRLDPAYSGGTGIARIGSGNERARAAVFEADGSVAVGGTTRSAGACSFEFLCPPTVPAVARFDAAGNADAGFGAGGLVRLERLAGWGYPLDLYDLIARRSGGLVAAGSGGAAGSIAYLTALLPDGSLDPGFGNGGIVEERETEPSEQWGFPPLAVTPEGEILAAVKTAAGPGDGPALVRYDRDGKLDLSYGGGKGYARVARYWEAPSALTLDAAGRALVLTKDGTLARVTPEGGIDPGFNKGLPVALKGRDPTYRAVAVQPDGKILVAGTGNWLRVHSRIRVVRLLPDGRLDPGFGKGGYANVACRRVWRCAAVRIFAGGDGRILLAGTVKDLSRPSNIRSEVPTRMALFRVLPDGRADRSFGRNGTVTLRVTRHSEARAATLSRGRIVVAGWALSRGGSKGVLARFRWDGRLDRSFGRDGVSRAFPTGKALPNAVLPRGRGLVVATRGGKSAVLGFDSRGRPDSRFRRLRATRLMPGLVAGPAAASQGGKIVLGWTQRARKGAPVELRLTRLAAR